VRRSLLVAALVAAVIALFGSAAVAVGTLGGPFSGQSTTRDHGQDRYAGMMGGQGRGPYAGMMGGQGRGPNAGVMRGSMMGAMGSWASCRCLVTGSR